MPCHCSTLLSAPVPLVLSPPAPGASSTGVPPWQGLQSTPGGFLPTAPYRDAVAGRGGRSQAHLWLFTVLYPQRFPLRCDSCELVTHRVLASK